MAVMNFYKRTGELIFGTRLKRVSDRFLMDISRVYKYLKIDFEMSWFPLFFLLNDRGGLTVTEIAGELEITHSAVSQLVGALEKKGLLHFINDASHRRRRRVYFTTKGLDLIRILKPIWDSILRCMREMLEEGQNSAYLLKALEEVEDAMKNPGIYERVMADLEKTRLGEPEVVDYDEACRASFNDLILKWIIDNREDAPLEAEVINDPGGMIEKDGNVILMAKLKKKCVGILALRIQEKKEADILYFIIDKKWKNHRIGKRLLQEGLGRLQKSGILNTRIRLNRRRTGTMRILKSAGFILKNIGVEENGRYGNQNIIMLERNLDG